MKASWKSFLYLIDLFHSFAGTVKQIVHKAFWDHLESELNEDPPEYEHAIKLFEEIKEVMFLLPCAPVFFCVSLCLSVSYFTEGSANSVKPTPSSSFFQDETVIIQNCK